MAGKGKRPIGGGEPPAPPRAGKHDRIRAPAPRRREASRSADPSDRSPARSDDADREEEEQEEEPRSGSPTEDAHEAPDSPLPVIKKKPRKEPRSSRNEFVHNLEEPGHFAEAMIKQGQRARDKGRGRSRSSGERNRRRMSGASASSGVRQTPSGAHGPLVPTPPARPPPPAMRKVTLHANTGRHNAGDAAQSSQAPLPPPPAGPTPDEHLRTAAAFLTSLHELERDAYAVRGTLEPLKNLVGFHIMNLRNEFKLVL